MAHPKGRLYQRLRSKGFPWVLVEFHKNGSPKPHADAFPFGVRCSPQRQAQSVPINPAQEKFVQISTIHPTGKNSLTTPRLKPQAGHALRTT